MVSRQLNDVKQKVGRYFAFTACFSLFVNVLQLTFPLYMLQIYDRVLSSQNMPTLVVITIAAVASYLVMGALDFIRSRLLVCTGVGIDDILSASTLREMIRASSRGEGTAYSRGLRDVNTLRTFLTGSHIFPLFDAPWIPIYLLVIYLLHPLLGIVATGGALLLLLNGYLNKRLTEDSLKDANVVQSYSSAFAQSCIHNAESVCGMGMLEGALSRWSSYNANVVKFQTKASYRATIFQTITKTVRLLMQVFIYGTGAYLALSGECTAGCMIAASIIMGRALSPIESTVSFSRGIVDALHAYRNLEQLFASVQSRDRVVLPAPRGAIMVDKVTLFRNGRYILKNVSFSLDKGTIAGLIGPSGAGKSTLCRLLLGLERPTAGEIRIDDSDLSAWDNEKLGPHIGYVSQDVALLSGTIAENIARMNKLDSSRIIEAAQKANVHELILRLPEGYETLVGRGGVTLSGGQRQRIALARALYGDPRIVILDEPNANLDLQGERALLDALDSLRKEECTVIITTHKVSMLSSADMIVMLQDGELRMSGPREAMFERLMVRKSVGKNQELSIHAN
ncbi:MAG: type I secretion system permease/ATPase [Chitinivibrionales bacterium]|nr:type I secretion system permease/ATPase [Chitinivibrionales bacterium]MBD3359026.1 type I secretion system permease/ATPase [Chitinivibrionales bacterium]